MEKSHKGASFFNYFSAKYLINLPERKDRLRHVQKQFEKHHLPFAEISLFEGVKCREKQGFRDLGVRGCFLSHLGVLKDAKARGAERTLVMEDDLGLCRDFFALQEQVIQELKIKKWDFAYFGNQVPWEEGRLGPSEIMGELPSEARLRGSHFYAVHERIFPHLIASLEAMLSRPDGSPDGGPMHIDGALGWFRRQNKSIIALGSRSVLGIQSSFQSDIHKNKVDEISLPAYFLKPIRKLKNIIKYGC